MGAAYNPTSVKTKAEGIALVEYALLFLLHNTVFIKIITKYPVSN